MGKLFKLVQQTEYSITFIECVKKIRVKKSTKLCKLLIHSRRKKFVNCS